MSTTKPKDKRALVTEEIITTEGNYVKDLDVCIRVFLKPLRELNLIKSDNLVEIFGNMELLYSVHKDLLKKLKGRLDQCTSDDAAAPILGDIFTETAKPLVSVYGQYCNDHFTALTVLDACKRRVSAFANFLDKQQNTNPEVAGLGLGDYLIKPIQRICKYPLLFKSLLEATKQGSEDWKKLKVACDTIDAVAVLVNKNRASYENGQRLKELCEQMENMDKCTVPLDAPGRVLRKEGTLIKYNLVMKAQKRYFFLFDDVLIYTREKSGKKKKYQFKGLIPLNTSVVGSAVSEQVTTASGIKFGFQITRLDQKRIYYLSAQSEPEKMDWIAALDEIIQRYLHIERTRKEKNSLERTESLDEIAQDSEGAVPTAAAGDQRRGSVLTRSLSLKDRQMAVDTEESKQRSPKEAKESAKEKNRTTKLLAEQEKLHQIVKEERAKRKKMETLLQKLDERTKKFEQQQHQSLRNSLKKDKSMDSLPLKSISTAGSSGGNGGLSARGERPPSPTSPASMVKSGGVTIKEADRKSDAEEDKLMPLVISNLRNELKREKKARRAMQSELHQLKNQLKRERKEHAKWQEQTDARLKQMAEALGLTVPAAADAQPAPQPPAESAPQHKDANSVNPPVPLAEEAYVDVPIPELDGTSSDTADEDPASARGLPPLPPLPIEFEHQEQNEVKTPGSEHKEVKEEVQEDARKEEETNETTKETKEDTKEEETKEQTKEETKEETKEDAKDEPKEETEETKTETTTEEVAAGALSPKKEKKKKKKGSKRKSKGKIEKEEVKEKSKKEKEHEEEKEEAKEEPKKEKKRKEKKDKKAKKAKNQDNAEGNDGAKEETHENKETSENDEDERKADVQEEEKAAHKSPKEPDTNDAEMPVEEEAAWICKNPVVAAQEKELEEPQTECATAAGASAASEGSAEEQPQAEPKLPIKRRPARQLTLGNRRSVLLDQPLRIEEHADQKAAGGGAQ